MPSTVRLILGDQLNPDHSWFGKKDASVTYVFMEVRSETDYVVHHAQKVIAIFAGMRRMAELLKKQGHKVRYFRLGDKDNRQSFADNLRTVFAETKAARFEYQEPDEWRLEQDLRAFAADCGLVTAGVRSEHFLDGRLSVSQSRHLPPGAATRHPKLPRQLTSSPRPSSCPCRSWLESGLRQSAGSPDSGRARRSFWLRFL